MLHRRREALDNKSVACPRGTMDSVKISTQGLLAMPLPHLTNSPTPTQTYLRIPKICKRGFAPTIEPFAERNDYFSSDYLLT